MVNNIRLHLNDDDIDKMKAIDPLIKQSTANRCDLYFRICDASSMRTVDLRSRLKFPLNKEIIEALEELDIKFDVNFTD